MTIAEHLLAVEIEDTIREIERELRQRLDLPDRVAVGFALERFADRVQVEWEDRLWR